MTALTLTKVNKSFGDRDGAVRRDDVLHEERRFRHHRPPARFVPPDRPVGEEHLKLAVVVHVLGNLVRQPQAHAMDPHRRGVGDLAHHVDVMDAAIDQRRCCLHQGLVRLPLGT